MTYFVSIIFGLVYLLSLPFSYLNSAIASFQLSETPRLLVTIPCKNSLIWNVYAVPKEESGYSEGIKSSSVYYAAEFSLTNNGQVVFDTVEHFVYPDTSGGVVSSSDSTSALYALKIMADYLPVPSAIKTPSAQCLTENETLIASEVNFGNAPGYLSFTAKSRP